MRKTDGNSKVRLIACLFAIFLTSTASGASSAYEGFTEDYQVFVGDLNSDGLFDLYIKERLNIVLLHGDVITPIVIPSPVDSFVLQQEFDGSYSIVTELSSDQLLVLAQWQPNNLVTYLISDLNLDGYKDIILKGISEASIGTYDQIVFADSLQNSAPQHIRSVDDDYRSFIEDAYRWIENEYYFEEASLANGWYDVEEGDTFLAWWSAAYLRFWDFTLNSNGQRLVELDEDPYDESTPPNGCTWVDCYFDTATGFWRLEVTVKELTLVYDDFYQHFNSDALAFGKEQQDSLEDLIDIIFGKIEIEIGGAEIVIVGQDDNLDEDDPFWDDLLMRIVLHDNFCAISRDGACVIVEDVTRVDMLVERQLEGSYFSGTCQTDINFTSGEYEVSGSNGLSLTGYTLERGGPDSNIPAHISDKCTNIPKRIPAGSYGFTMGSTNSYTNVPIVDSSSFSRTGILVHNSAGAMGTIGCILVGKTPSSSGTFSGDARASSRQALNEIRQALTYQTNGANKFLFQYGVLTVENSINQGIFMLFRIYYFCTFLPSLVSAKEVMGTNGCAKAKGKQNAQVEFIMEYVADAEASTTEEPREEKLHAGICTGGVGRPAFLP